MILAPRAKKINRITQSRIQTKNLEPSQGACTREDRVNVGLVEYFVILGQFAGQPMVVRIISLPLLGGIFIFTQGGGQVYYLGLIIG